MKKRLFLAASVICLLAAQTLDARITIKGKVTLDGKPAAGVQVSDGSSIVVTNARGRYALESDKRDSMVFITTPSGTVAVAEDGIRPGFWARLGKDPGKVEKHDFKLVSENQENYRVIFLPDLHLSNDPRRDDIKRFSTKVFPFIQERIAEAGGPVYLVNLGDFTHEVYWYEFNFNEEDAFNLCSGLGLETPFYSVIGNHGHDGAIVGKDVDFRSAWLYRRVWGPDRYSVNIGGDHWVFLDDIVYINVEGKGKKAPGIKGDRSYDDAFTSSQLAWLEKDLSYVPSDANVYICTHSPIFKGGSETATEMIPAEQLSALERICSRFDNVCINFAGHIHKFDFTAMKEYPHLFQYGLPCASGIMWETPADAPLYCGDGSNAGLMIADITNGERKLHYETYEGNEPYYRIYDMNGVAEAYRQSEGVRMQRKLAPGRADYSAPEFTNCVFVNYWAWKPGDTVEIIENGKSLPVKNVRHEDPMQNFAYELPHIVSPVKHHNIRQKAATNHMYEAKTENATTDVEVIIRDGDGNILFQETIHRPKPFRLGL